MPADNSTQIGINRVRNVGYELTKNAAAVAADMGHHGTDIFFKHYRALAHPGDGEKWFAINPDSIFR